MAPGNSSDLHRSRQLSTAGGSLVACRICDAVFSNSQALITHIGSHMADDHGAAAASRNQHLRMPNCRLPIGMPFSQPPRTGHLFSPNRYMAAGSIGADGEFIWTHQLHPFSRNLLKNGPPYPPSAGQYVGGWGGPAEESMGDCTRPYINQLEKCIPKAPDLADEDDSRRLDFTKLDLTLKL